MRSAFRNDFILHGIWSCAIFSMKCDLSLLAEWRSLQIRRVVEGSVAAFGRVRVHRVLVSMHHIGGMDRRFSDKQRSGEVAFPALRAPLSVEECAARFPTVQRSSGTMHRVCAEA